MFNLKSQLLEKGLVTKEQAEKADSPKQAMDKKKMAFASFKNTDYAQQDRERALRALRSQNKSEQYTTIRKWVNINRLDKKTHSILDCEKFFVCGNDEQLTWLSLHKDVIADIKCGKAGVIAYMSNHGLAHAVVPRDIAEDIALFFPDWLKVLNDKG